MGGLAEQLGDPCSGQQRAPSAPNHGTLPSLGGAVAGSAAGELPQPARTPAPGAAGQPCRG
ncbi:hypothetical protein DIPPA_22006 [Diplonema papillatum]|nr:hypothetical protein DIPPA_22006 [Diplonema papillatum]